MPRKEKSIHYIYKTTCKVTERYYIGMHSTTNINDGYVGSGKRLRYSIKKYGIDNHIREILEFVETRELLIERERNIVNSELMKDDLCMNLKDGGTGGFCSAEHKTNCIASSRESYKKHLEIDKEFRDKMFAVLADNRLKAQKNGRYNGNKSFTGRIHSKETKQLMSDGRVGKNCGESNSQYGTCWITNGQENKKIKLNDLDFFILNGWGRGRI